MSLPLPISNPTTLLTIFVQEMNDEGLRTCMSPRPRLTPRELLDPGQRHCLQQVREDRLREYDVDAAPPSLIRSAVRGQEPDTEPPTRTVPDSATRGCSERDFPSILLEFQQLTVRTACAYVKQTYTQMVVGFMGNTTDPFRQGDLSGTQSSETTVFAVLRPDRRKLDDRRRQFRGGRRADDRPGSSHTDEPVGPRPDSSQ